ncbi:restriction endonuclease [Bacillus cereus]|nr:restriction endonuclease [Bacillus cereus]
MSKKIRYKRRGGKSLTFGGGIFLGLLFIGLYYVNLSNSKSVGSIKMLSGLRFSLWEIIIILACLVLLYAASKVLIVQIQRSIKKQKLRMSGIYKIDKMSGSEFENYLTVFFEDLNYRVEDVGGKGDRGADKILIEPGSGKRICVQAKRWDKNVTFEAIQQVFTAKSIYECEEAWIITNRGFTKQLRETAEKLNVNLWDRERLIDNMYRYNKGKRKRAAAHGTLFLASPESNVFHDLSCEHGRKLGQRQESIRFDSYNLAMKSGRRKCSCYK